MTGSRADGQEDIHTLDIESPYSVTKMHFCYLLVEEKNDGCISEPFIITDGIKQLQTLLHSVLKQGQLC